ncbi:hypothetical protein Dimus_009979 [Dionaea muscipula]
MEAEWNAPRLPLETLGIGPFHSGELNNMSDIPAFYPHGNSARNMSLLGYSVDVSNSNSIVATVLDSSCGRHMVRDSSGALLVDSVPGLSGMHTTDSSVAVEWSPAEQQLLQDGLVKFADELSMMKYIKIAATLREKTVRDQGKRRKQDEAHVRKATCRKDKLAESRSNPSPIMHDTAGYSFPSPQMEQLEHSCGALTAKAAQLLDQNRQVLEQIDANLSAMQPQKNIALVNRSRKYFEELSAILKKIPGGISQLPELPPLAELPQEDSCSTASPVQTSIYYMPDVLGRQQDKLEPPC